MYRLRRRLPRLCILASLVAALFSSGAFAATVRYRSDGELIAASERVIRGRVLSTRGERGPGGRIYTVTTIAVLEDFSGNNESTLEIRELGGKVGNEFLYIGGAVHYEPGSEVVVCLERSAGGWLRSISMGFSKFDVVATADGDAELRRSLKETVVLGNAQPEPPRRLSSFRQLAERVRGVRSRRPAGAEAFAATPPYFEGFTLLNFGAGSAGRWVEADTGIPIRWFIDSSAPPPVPGNGSPELQIALAGWTNPPQASIVLSYAGFTDQTISGGPWPSLGPAGVVFFEDPENDVDLAGSNVLAIGGGWGSDSFDGGTVNGRTFRRFTSAFVIIQNAAQLPPNLRLSEDFTRVLEHEVGHGIGLGHTQTDGTVFDPLRNIMYPSCCSSSTPIPPAIGPDDLAGLMFLYPVAGCSYTVSSNSAVVLAGPANVSVAVTTQAGCEWNVSGLPSWIAADVISGTGSGAVRLSISTNVATSGRTATLSIASQPFTVTQHDCACAVGAGLFTFSARGGTASLSVSSSFCEWTAVSSAPWVKVTAGATGVGSGIVSLSVDPNTGPGRTATVIVAANTVTIWQADGTIRTTSDFNDDGRSDLVWRHQTDGRISVWHMSSTRLAGGTLLTPDRVVDTNWKIVGVWDPNRDGRPDLLWRHEGNGNLAVWTMRGTTLLSGEPLTPAAVPDTEWAIVAVADMDGDGDDDLVWQHRTQGLVSAWLMNGTTMVEGRLLTPSRVTDTNWRIVGSGDFDRDGRADLVWQHQVTGQSSVWFMNGTTQVRGTLLSPPGVADTNWQIRAVCDLNGDGWPDLVWQNVATGSLAAWMMNGLTMTEGTYLIPDRVTDLNWRIAGPR